MARIITFTNQKGGVGKTTSCINMAAYIAGTNKKVLVVDMDPQGNASSGLGVTDKHKRSSVYDVLVGKCDITDNVIIKTSVDNLDILPTSTNLAGAEVELAMIKKEREFLLKNALNKVIDNYDFVLIDCPPSLGLLTINSLTASNSLIVPIQCEFFALEGLSQLMYTIKQIQKYLNSNIEIDGIILTMYDKRSKLTQQVEENIRKYFKDKVFETKIPRNIRLAEAPSHGLAISQYDANCVGAVAYRNLTQEYIKRIER